MQWPSAQQCLAGRHRRSEELTSVAIKPSQEKMARSISCRHRRRELTSAIALDGIKASKADEAIRAAADIEEKELTSDMAESRGHPKKSRHRSGRVDISYGRRGHQGARRFHHASSIFTTQWLLTTHPYWTLHHWVFLLHFVINIKYGKCIEGFSDTFVYLFISYLFTMHLDHLQPEQHIFIVDLVVCLSGIKFHHSLCIFLAIIFPYLHHIKAWKIVILVNLEII